MRIVIVTYESPQSNLMIDRILREFCGSVVGIVTSDVVIAGKSSLQSLFFLLRRAALGYVVPKALEIILGRVAGWASPSRRKATPTLAQMSGRLSIPLVSTKNINSPATMQTIATWSPDLIVSVNLNQVIGPELIRMPGKGAINVHGAFLPRYRGLFPQFWVLANGESETGVTVHWLAAQLDAGPILLQERLPIEPVDTVVSLGRKTAELGGDLLIRGIRQIEAGDPPRLEQDEAAASYFSWPQTADVRRFKQRGRRYGSVFEFRR
jgi:folate-dependent phosphoribosylglycinamide formyltransferase PurN